MGTSRSRVVVDTFPTAPAGAGVLSDFKVLHRPFIAFHESLVFVHCVRQINRHSISFVKQT